MNPTTAVPLDPEVVDFMALVRQAGYPPLEALPPAKARKVFMASIAATELPGEEVASVRDLIIDGPAGALALRIYRGQGTVDGEVLPGVLYLHGGGFVIGGLDSHDRICRRLANVARVCVVAVDYRLAPEHPFPAAIDDCAAALRWVAGQAEALRIDRQALGVAGDSAGGNLAAVLALMARDDAARVAGDGALPALAHQALIYPVTDLVADSDSYRRTAADLPLSSATMHYFIGHYTPQAKDRTDWRASPLRARSLSGLPPSVVLTVAHDPLCDEGRAYARRLGEAGVRVTEIHCNDQVHGVLGLSRRVSAAAPIGDQVFSAIGHALRRHTVGATLQASLQEPRAAATPGAARSGDQAAPTISTSAP